MNTEDQRMKTQIGESVSTFDPLFAGARSNVDHRSPAIEAALREGESLRLDVERLQGEVKEIEALISENWSQRADFGIDEEEIESENARLHARLQRCEGQLQRAIAGFVEFSTAADESESVAKDLDGYIALSDLVALDLDSGSALDERESELRLATLTALIRYVFQDGYANPWLAFKNFLALVRRACPQYLDGISKADLARLLGETRAATGHREIRFVEGQLRKWGAAGFQLLGGQKSMDTRARCAESARGNRNRSKRRKRGGR